MPAVVRAVPNLMVIAFFLGQVWPRLRDARRQTELCRDLMKPHTGAGLGAAACH